MASSIASHGLPADWQTKTTPPAENTFTTSAPARLRSRLGTFEVDGTGAGRWGPLSFDAAGGMRGDVKIAAGTFDVGTLPPEKETTTTITFPAGRFTDPPFVALNSFNGWLIVKARYVTASSAQIMAIAMPGKTVHNGLVEWIAIGK